MEQATCPKCGKESEAFILSVYHHCLDCEKIERRPYEGVSERLATDRYWGMVEFYRRILGCALRDP